MAFDTNTRERRTHEMHPSFALFAPHHLVIPAQVEELLSSKHEASGGKVALVVVVLQDGLNLPGCNIEVFRLGPKVPIVPRDSSVLQVLANKLSVNIVLPAHSVDTNNSLVEVNSSFKL